ncbi:MAG: hypothetical protein HETSPECPRED_008526 [Heterodermia speciosa]|uniref:HAD-like protein n=1 Tax=Heterodermia speciosa TaxID=116794 RepID=A0A8H3ITN9_9LECA|nr:MAG: hypothetical protein HETSPECPRED_008526 [Heterodermia speciosa]
MLSPNQPKALIFDLGDVLFSWSPDTKTTIPAVVMRKLISSGTWAKYECGQLQQAVCYRELAKDFSLPVSEIAEAFSQARDSLAPNEAMITLIHELKRASGGSLHVYAMSNISIEDYTVLSTKMADWTIFDRVFTSGQAGMRKPDIPFYRYVLQEINASPSETVFVDDKIENVRAARSLGITGVQFDDASIVAHTLRSLFDGPVKRGYEYLYRNAKRFSSMTDSGIMVSENFAQLLILDTTHDA